MVTTSERETRKGGLSTSAQSQRSINEMGIYARFGSMARPKEGRLQDNGYGKIAKPVTYLFSSRLLVFPHLFRTELMSISKLK